MRRTERSYTDAPADEFLREGSEPALLVRPQEDTAPYRVPLYPGEDLAAALARARQVVPDARAIELQVYLRGRFHCARLP